MQQTAVKNAGLYVLLILHAVGFAGLHSPWADWFAQLTPLNLLITAVILFLPHKEWSSSFILFCLTVFTAGIVVEIIGVQSGLVFGTYAYGANMGPKIMGTPPVIGINWLMLVYAFGVLTDPLKVHIVLKALFAALLMVALDVFIEPVAMQLDFWDWQNGQVPVQNYLGWLMIAFVFFLLFFKLNFQKRNPLAVAVLVVQALFFILLNLTL